MKKRLFWNTKFPQYTFLSGDGQNPAGAMQEMGEGPFVDPKDFGAVYNIQDITPDQALANFGAIEKAIASLPDSGGTLIIKGHLQYRGTIKNPQRVFEPQVLPRPIPFKIEGFVSGALVQLDQVPAIQLDTAYSYQVGSTSARVEILNLSIYSKGKGIVVTNGGKEVKLKSLIISLCEDTALEINGFDGGVLTDIYLIGNKKDGGVISQAHQIHAVITARNNFGNGLTIKDSNSWNAWLYCESNKGYGLILSSFKDSTLQLWLEANNKGKNVFQGTMQNCTRLTASGNGQHEADTAFLSDDISRFGLSWQRVNYPIDKKLNVAWPPVESNIHGPNNNDPVYTPKSKVVGNTVEVSVPVGWYSKQNANVTSNWIELYGQGWYPELRRQLKTGSSIVVRVKAKLDAVTAAYFLQHTNEILALKAVVQGTGASIQSDAQNIYLTSTNEFEAEVIVRVVKDGLDDIRLFLYICPVVFGTMEPPVPHKFTITSCEFFML